MKKKIALLAGGYTGESVVSMKSAAMVANSLDRNVYEIYQIVINKEKWVYIDEQKQELLRVAHKRRKLSSLLMLVQL